MAIDAMELFRLQTVFKTTTFGITIDPINLLVKKSEQDKLEEKSMAS